MAAAPDPLLTRQGWELVTPLAAAGSATVGWAAGLIGLLVSLLVAVGLIGVIARRGRSGRQQQGGTSSRRQTRTAATRTVGAGRGAGARQILGGRRGAGLPGLGRSGAGRAPGAGRSGSSGAGRSSAGGSRGGLRGLLGRIGGRRGSGAGGTGPKAGSRAGAGSAAGKTGRGSGIRGRLAGLTGRRSSSGRSGASGTGSRGRGGGAVTGRGSTGSRGTGTGRSRTGGRAAGLLGRLRGRGTGSGSGTKPGRIATSGATGRSRSGAGGAASRGGGSGTRRDGPSGAHGRWATGRHGSRAGAKGGGRVPGFVGRILRRKPSTTSTDQQTARPTRSGRRNATADRDAAVAGRAIQQQTTGPGRRRRATPGDRTRPTSTTPSTTRGGKTVGAQFGASPLRTIVEAIHSGASLRPENALTVCAWYEDLPDFIEAVSQMFTQHGSALTEEFYLDPSAGEYARALGSLFARFHDPASAASSSFWQAHRDDIKKIREPAPHQAKWDISANPR